MNLLHLESSPYLLQHAHNPVDWHAWNDATLAEARESGKMLLISIGYSACHWCHVMERESFEDEKVARLMNEHFICIKVDREERPDVDQLYMQAAHLITGRGGWPLNAFALPDGRPFYAGTYFPKANWIDLLRQLASLWENEQLTILNAADQITHGIEASGHRTSSTKTSSASSGEPTAASNQQTDTSGGPTDTATIPNIALVASETTTLPPLTVEQFNELYKNYRHRIDFKLGGEKRAPKFPMPSMWEFLLHFHSMYDHEEALTAVNATLINMARGGIYDHAGGGFARYSTDERWHVPHFEKMLYDNAQLITLYAHAFQHTGHSLYKDVVRETLEFIERELTDSDGGFYSALDADTEGEEGRFYVWKELEIDRLLGEKAGLFKEVYNITTEGNWERGKNILFRRHTVKLHADGHGMHHHQLENELRTLRQDLLNYRNQRVRPGLDDKILCSWNALMVKAYFVAYKTMPDSKLYLTTALGHLQFLISTFVQSDGSLLRNHKAGKTSIEGLLDDYAFVISTLLEAYQTVFDEKYTELARQLTDYCLLHFWDEKVGLFYYTHQRSTGLAVRMKELNDNVIPASNSEMALNMYFLGTLLENADYLTKAHSMCENMADEIESNIYYHSNWGRLALMLTDGLTEVAIAGPECMEWAAELQKRYLPQLIVSASAGDSNLPLLKNKYIPEVTRAFICKNQSCGEPIQSRDALLKALSVTKIN